MKPTTKTITALTLLLLAMQAPAALAQGEVWLQPLLEQALESNTALQAEEARYQAALAEVPQAGALPDPQAGLGFFALPVETRVGAQRASLSFSQQLPWFGTLSAKERAATLRAEAIAHNWQGARNRVFSEIKQVYTELYFLQKAEAVTESNLRLVQSLQEVARVGFEGNRAGLSDVLRAEMELEELRERLQTLAADRQPLLRRLQALLGTETLPAPTFPDSLWEEPLPAAAALADSIAARNPQLQRFQSDIAALEAQKTVAEKMGMPGFTLGTSYTAVSPRTDMDVPENGQNIWLLPQVGIRLPVYRKQYRAAVQQTEWQQQATRLQMEDTRQQLLAEAETFVRDYQEAARKLQLYQRLKTLAQQSLDLLQTEFSAGTASFEELLQVERKLLQYQLQIERARANRNKAAYQLQRLY